MPTSGSVVPPPLPTAPAPSPEPAADAPLTEGLVTITARRSDAAASLDSLAADLESIADRWNASRTRTATELDQVRATLAKAQAALAVLSELR